MPRKSGPFYGLCQLFPHRESPPHFEAIRKIKILHHCKSDDLRVDFKY